MPARFLRDPEHRSRDGRGAGQIRGGLGTAKGIYAFHAVKVAEEETELGSLFKGLGFSGKVLTHGDAFKTRDATISRLARREAASFAFFGKLDLSGGHLAEVAGKARQLALRGVAHLLPQPVGAVVQDDLHNPSI